LHRKIASKSFKFIKYAFKLLLENNNKISFFFILSFQPSAAQLSQARGPARSPCAAQLASSARPGQQPQRGPARLQRVL